MPTAEVVSLERESLFKAATAALGTAATYLWGGWDTVIKALVVLVCLDYVTGVIAAAVQGQLNSTVGARGIARKVMIFAIVAAANILDGAGGLGEPILRTATAIWYAANEAISITENAGEAGVPIPTKLRDMIERLKDGGDGNARGS